MVSLNKSNTVVEVFVYFIQSSDFFIPIAEFIQDLVQVQILKDFQVLHFAFELPNAFRLILFVLFESVSLVVKVLQLSVELFDESFIMGQASLGQFQFLLRDLLSLFCLGKLVPECSVLSKFFSLLVHNALVFVLAQYSLHIVKSLYFADVPREIQDLTH